ncbi:response regulator [Flavobacterium pectinovorum]|uniref:Response regulator n=1 Tax=Flavobacterium pectinovorum TaxID=29533 RepID=A0A502EEQ8_9FLAO|nr:response regulator [Flavobacterium pectinovorum]TPG34841.1 response regulator [Flavobacterium pectinovorum]
MENKENIRILLTDDDEDEREFFGQAIADLHLNYQVEFCKNGVELLDRLYDKNTDIPDIIFLDLNMPILSGFETLQKIREDNRFKNIPIIAIYSTSATPDGVKNTFKLGANAYIVKPISFTDQKNMLKKVIEIDWIEKSANAKIESFVITL